jgi:hypothetical protein
MQRLEVNGHMFHTDARMALLRLTPVLEPASLILIDCTRAAWDGPRPFRLAPLTSAADLHLDRHALARIGQNGHSSSGVTERTLCVE